MIIPTGDYSNYNIHRYINRKKNSLLNNVGDSLLVFSHNYHRSVDDAINLYVSLGEVSKARISDSEEKNSKGILGRSKLLNESLGNAKRNSEKKRTDVKELKKQMNNISKMDLKKYLLNGNDIEAIKGILLGNEIDEIDAEMLASLIVDYENLKTYTLNQDYSFAKSFVENESDPNYEIELIKNEKSRAFMKYQDEYRNYINAIENFIKRNHEQDDEEKDFIARSNENVRNMITSSIKYIKDGEIPSNDIISQNNDLIIEILNSSKNKKDNERDKYKELLDSHKYIRADYMRLLEVKDSDVVKTITEKINTSTEEQELESKKKKTY